MLLAVLLGSEQVCHDHVYFCSCQMRIATCIKHGILIK